MKSLIVCVSVSHGNTAKVAATMAEVLDARVVEPEDITVAELDDYDLVGFGSGIFGMAFHPRLRAFIHQLPRGVPGRAFLFATSGGPELPWWRYTRPMIELLESKGVDVVGTFRCRGHDTWLPLRLVGGINKGRPNAADLDAARSFATNLRDQTATHRSSATSRGTLNSS